MDDKKKYSVSFKNNEKEQDLKKWFEKKSEIIGPGNFIKQVLYEKYLQEIDKADK